MSTKFTKKSPSGLDLVDSHALALTQAMRGFQGRMIAWLLDELAAEGFAPLSAGQLTFLGTLDCGANHASEIARRLGMSRQAVHKVVRELEKAGWLTTEPDAQLGNQRIIRFTPEGEAMMASARHLFARLDKRLLSAFGENGVRALHRFLDFEP